MTTTSPHPMHEVLGQLVRGELTREQIETLECRRGDGVVVRVRDVTREDLNIHGAWLAASLEADRAEVGVLDALMAEVDPYVREDESIPAALERGAIPAGVQAAAHALMGLLEDLA